MWRCRCSWRNSVSGKLQVRGEVAGSTNLAKSLWQWGQGKVLFFEPELALRFVRPVAADVVSMVEVFSSTIRVLAIVAGLEILEGGEAWSEELLERSSRSHEKQSRVLKFWSRARSCDLRLTTAYQAYFKT